MRIDDHGRTGQRLGRIWCDDTLLWMNGGLSCDGDSVALTAATQPSIEEILLGGLPGLPEVAMHWPLLDFQCGPDQGPDNVIEWWHRADRGELEPFILAVEGSVPDESIKSDGYWTGFGNNPDTGQPMTANKWLDRLAPKAWAVLAVGTCAAYGGIHAMAGNPTGAMGVPDYLGWGWKSKAGIPIVCVPGCPVQPDNLSRDHPVHALPRRRPRARDRTRRRTSPQVVVRGDGARGL
ncbi:hydrogenase small subunit [Kutzneria sp. 744]|nr:hydrogenase small subunit [Kutzneria sp. 744]